MKVSTLVSNLKDHGVKTIIKDSRLFAIEEFYNAPWELVDVTDFNVQQLRDFLGYDDTTDLENYN